jgi:hypothetical protein
MADSTETPKYSKLFIVPYTKICQPEKALACHFLSLTLRLSFLPGSLPVTPCPLLEGAHRFLPEDEGLGLIALVAMAVSFLPFAFDTVAMSLHNPSPLKKKKKKKPKSYIAK